MYINAHQLNSYYQLFRGPTNVGLRSRLLRIAWLSQYYYTNPNKRQRGVHPHTAQDNFQRFQRTIKQIYIVFSFEQNKYC